MGGTFDQKEERIRELEYRRMEISVSEEQKEKRLKKNEQSLKNLWNCGTPTDLTNIYNVGPSERANVEKIAEREHLKK